MARRATLAPAVVDAQEPEADTSDALSAVVDAQEVRMESPDGDVHLIVPAGVQALLALDWTIVEEG